MYLEYFKWVGFIYKFFYSPPLDYMGASQLAPMVDNLPANAEDARDMGRFPGGGNSNPLQYSCLKNPIDRASWWVTIHGVAKSRTQLSY